MEALAFPNIHQLFGEGADASIAKIRGSLKSWAQSEAHNALSVEALETILTIQAEVIVNGSGQSPTTVHSRELSLIYPDDTGPVAEISFGQLGEYVLFLVHAAHSLREN